MRIRDWFRDRVRAWLLGEEIGRIATIHHDIGALRESYEKALELGERALRGVTARFDGLETIQARSAEAALAQKMRLEQTDVRVIGIEHATANMYKLLQASVDELQALRKLIEPKAARIRAGNPPPPMEWDRIQAESLKEFDEPERKTNGKPVHK